MDRTSISLPSLATGRGGLLAWLLPLLAIGLYGCAGRPTVATSTEDQLAWVLGGAGELQESGPALIEPQQLLQISEEMHQFALTASATGKNEGERIRLLVDALHSEQGLALRYDATATLSPEDAFR